MFLWCVNYLWIFKMYEVLSFIKHCVIRRRNKATFLPIRTLLPGRERHVDTHIHPWMNNYVVQEGAPMKGSLLGLPSNVSPELNLKLNQKQFWEHFGLLFCNVNGGERSLILPWISPLHSMTDPGKVILLLWASISHSLRRVLVSKFHFYLSETSRILTHTIVHLEF